MISFVFKDYYSHYIYYESCESLSNDKSQASTTSYFRNLVSLQERNFNEHAHGSMCICGSTCI